MLISAPHPAADRHALIAQARQSLLSDSAAPVRAEVEPWIAQSWQRCLARGLEPTRRVAFDAVSATAASTATTIRLRDMKGFKTKFRSGIGNAGFYRRGACEAAGQWQSAAGPGARSS